MAKALRTAALVVGAVALVATGVGAAASAGVFGAAAASAGGTLAGISVATIGTIGTLASVGAGVLGIAAGLSAKRPTSSLGGDQTRFTANKDQGLPYVMGRTSVSGFIIHRQTHGADNVYQTFFGILSAAGPIDGVEAFKVDGVDVSFGANGAALNADYSGFMWRDIQLGATPETRALQSPMGAVPGWDASSRLSGYAAYAWTLKYDKKGKVYAAGVPEPTVVARGVRAYDPTRDSTYPGGSGPCRVDDESSWIYTENAALHALTWVIGRRANGKRVMGVGAPISGIDVAAYVEAANVAIANGWKMGGVVYSTDRKWDALKAILQAGGAEPCRSGAIISCVVKAPRVSLDTIRASDIVGEASVTGSQRRRERINAVVPRYRSEAHDWEMVPAAVVVVPAYVAEDGGQRTRELEYPLVQDAGQAAQLAAYDIVNAREFGPIVLPLKTRWVGYRPGDCLTIDVPDLNMVGQTAIVLDRSLDPSTGIVTLTLRSETAAKHDFALGRTANPPPTPSLQVIDPSQLLVPGVSAVWNEVVGDGRPENYATNGATLDPNAPTGVLRDFAGKPFYPEELRNADLSLSPSGRLTALIQGPGGNLVPKDLGQVDAGSIGASTESAERRYAAGIERLAQLVARVAADTSLLRKTIRDAGIVVDPASGQVSIYANEQLAKVAISLDAQTQSISLLATRAEVDQKILEAVLDPTQAAELGDIIAQITQIGIDLDAAEGLIALKADKTTLDTLGLRVTGAEQVIQSLPDKASVRQDVTASRYGFNQYSAEAVLRAMLAGDKSLRLTQQSLAAARQEISANVIDNSIADARFRLDLSAQIGAVSGLVAQETIARVEGDKAVAATVTSLKTTVDGHTTKLTTYGQSIDGINSKWGVEIDSDGRATGFALNGSPTRTDFVLRVDRFYLSRPGAPPNESPFAVFDISGGIFYLNAKLKAQSIDTPMFNGRVVTRREAVTLGTTITGAGGGLGDVLTFMFDLPYPADVIIQFIGSQTYSGSPVPDWGADILVNGVTQAVQGGGAGIYSSGFALACKVSLPANAAGQPQTVKARWSGGNGNIALKNGTLIMDGAFA